MSDDPYLSVLRQRIQQAREQAGISQEVLAEHLGISRRHYQRYERSTPQDTFEPTIMQLRQIAKCLQVSLYVLVAEPTEEELQNLQPQKPGRPPKRTPASQE